MPKDLFYLSKASLLFHLLLAVAEAEISHAVLCVTDATAVRQVLQALLI